MYISKFEILFNYPKISLTDKELDYLQNILEGDNTAYAIFKRINKKRGIAYKNVHITIKKLKDSKLIEPLKVEGENYHAAIPYKLTDEGLFNIFADRFNFDLSFIDSVRIIVDSMVIKKLLGDIFEFKNLVSVFFSMRDHICIYLHECCKAIKYGAITTLDFAIFFAEDEEKEKLDIYLNSRLKLFVIDLIMELTDKFDTIKNINYYDELSNHEGELRQFYDEFNSLLNEDKNFMDLAEKINDDFTKGYNILTNKS